MVGYLKNLSSDSGPQTHAVTESLAAARANYFMHGAVVSVMAHGGCLFFVAFEVVISLLGFLKLM